MTTGYRIEMPNNAYFLTFTVVDWVDIFTRKIYRDIVIDSFTFCRQFKELHVWAYVIMSNHLHCILSAKNNNLPNILRDLKRHTASQILKSIQRTEESRRDWMLKRFEFAAKSNIRNSSHQFWMHENHAEVLTSANFIAQKLNYIHFNPVRAGWVDKAEDWLYSSARNYAFQPALMEVDLLDLSLDTRFNIRS